MKPGFKTTENLARKGVRQREFRLANGLRIAADEIGDPSSQTVILLHGIGQTRASWKNALMAFGAAGIHAIAYDARGHGESDWSASGEYTLSSLTEDLRQIVKEVQGSPDLVGASLGGITALVAEGEGKTSIARRLVLVDVTPPLKMAGAERIRHFMESTAVGFACVEDAALAVSAYNPGRPPSRDLSGLKRTLRMRDGRYFWHWDPAFLTQRIAGLASEQDRMAHAARHVVIPTRLIRGTKSDLVGPEEVAAFRDLMPDLDYVDVAGAGHMIVGDRNDAFNAAVIDFLGPAA